MITSLPSIAILIDCWKSLTKDIDAERCFRGITNFLDNTDSIKTIALASYNCKTEHEKGGSIWYQNNKLMCGQSIRKKIPHLKQAHDYLNRYNNKYPIEETDPIILNYTNPNKHQISMLWWWELEYYLLLHPEIKNIYFFGKAWEECVRIRPLGYEAVLEERPDLNILINTKCVVRNDYSLPQLDLSNDPDWAQVEGNIYLYQPTIRL
jgi:hypothetical protein